LYPEVPVIGLREGSALLRKGQQRTLLGQLDTVVFTAKQQKIIPAGSDMSVYL